MHKYAIMLTVINKIKTVSKKNFIVKSPRQNIGFGAIMVLFIAVSFLVPIARDVVLADTYSDQLNALRQKNAEAQQVLNGLQGQAATYQQAIDNLSAQMNTLQAAIDANVQEQTKLQDEITANQNELNRQRSILAEDVKAMYVDGTPSTFEVFASSKDLSDFVDKQEYRSRVQNKLQDTMKRIATLQKQLQEQKAKVEQLLKEQQTQQAQLDSDRSQQQQLLSYNEGQQSAYTSQIRANNAEMAKVQAAQRAALAAVNRNGGSGYVASSTGGSIRYANNTAGQYCGGGYSYCWAGFDQVVSDPWGLNWARECVHYVADYLNREGKQVPNFGGGNGYAYMWVGYTTSLGVATVTSNPQHGDVAYMPIGGYGHVAIVEYANGDGTYHVSQMNWPYGGYYSEMDVYPQNLTFLHFYDR